MLNTNKGVVLVLLWPLLSLAQASHSGRIQMTVPGATGVLVFDPGPTTWESRLRPDGLETQLQAMNRPDHLNISAFLHKVTFEASPERCRTEWWSGAEEKFKKQKMKLENLQQSSREGMAIVEFIVPEFQGIPVRQKSLHAYLGSHNLCAEIHLSKVQFVPQDQHLFDELLATAQLAPEQIVERQPDTVDQNAEQAKISQYMAEASRLYMERNYSAAAERYQQVLDMEKKKRTLNQRFFRVLVDNLGMSYGIPGNLDKAKETFEYGISQDPEYPLFYYNMACAYGEMGKEDQALEQLKMAYRYKSNMTAGESFPDPLQDDSFRSFVKHSAFVHAVKEMQQQ